MTRGKLQRSFSRVFLSALLALTASGCIAQQGKAKNPIENETLRMPFSVDVRGALAGRFSRNDESVHIRTLQQSELTFLLVKSSGPVRLDSGVIVHAGINLIGFHGDGSYDIGSPEFTAPSPSTSNQSSFSNVWADAATADGKPTGMFRVGKCHIDVKDGGRSGRAQCASLSDYEGISNIALNIEWGKFV